MDNRLYSRFIYILLCWTAIFNLPSSAGAITLESSVRQALKNSPELKALDHEHDAIGQELTRARGNYRPSLDLVMGYGSEQHSDSTTRQAGADPSDEDWDSRSDVSLRLTQRLYDGGETGQQVAIQKASLDGSRFRRKAATQSVTLEAIIAHLEIYRQHELVAVARRNLKFHEEIYQLLAEREQAGAGNIADVTQTQARVARARSNLYISEADLSKGMANYQRIVGIVPTRPDYVQAPLTLLPKNLEAALRQTEQQNPELLALRAGIDEANARLNLTRANYKPKVNLELSSRYNDQLEGDTSYQHTSDALVVLRWNLYRGGQDRAAAKAALARKYQTRANRNDRLFELQEATKAAWASFTSLQQQKKAYHDATNYSRETLNTYLRQFTISKRSLLDVLSAANDYAQSASQLVAATVNETLAAYRILKLGGVLTVGDVSIGSSTSAVPDFRAEAMQFPDILGTDDAPATEIFQSASEDTMDDPAPAADPASAPDMAALHVESSLGEPLYQLTIGPCLTKKKLVQATDVLTREGIPTRETQGKGPVSFIRLLEGVYAPEEARQRLADLKKTTESAFLLKEDGQLAVYAGSFHRPGLADRLARRLSAQQIEVSKIPGMIEKTGTLVISDPMNLQTAEAISGEIKDLSLTVEIQPAP